MWVEAMLDQLVLASKGLRAGNVSKLTELGAGDAPRAMPSYVMNGPQAAKPDFLRLHVVAAQRGLVAFLKRQAHQEQL